MKTTAMTADEMTAARSTLTADGFRKVGRALYRWSERAEMWSVVDASARRAMAARVSSEAMTAAARAMPWHQFVCHYVADRTARASVEGYSVRGSGDAWELCYLGAPQFAPMSASSLYGWFERTGPLLPLSREADDFRATANNP